MARTIMVSNEVYEELKAKKAKRSFSETIIALLNSKKEKRGNELRKCLGILKKDKEFDSIEKTLNKGWKEWNKRYA